MAPTHAPTKSFSAYKALSFDVFGTLIDWESGVLPSLRALLINAQSHASTPKPIGDRTLLASLNKLLKAIQASDPKLSYDQVLARGFLGVAAEYDITSWVPEEVLEEEAQKFGKQVGSWPVFPDTVKALQALGKHYKLIVLSNVDDDNFSRILSGPFADVKWDAVYTAEMIGSYKPDLANFHYLIKHEKEDLGIEKEEMLHVAQSLTHDHVPCKDPAIELPSVWIARNKETSPRGTEEEAIKTGAGWEWEFRSMGEFAAEAEKSFGEVK
jgi:2-haloalkanoic acid dehalogenase type II